MQVITRFNNVFQCAEYLARNGRDFTLHADKAQTFAGHDVAVRWARQLGLFPSCSITDAPVGAR